MRLQSPAPQQMASVLILVALLTLTRTDAGVIPGRWEKVDALPPGAHLELILRTGDEHIKGSFKKSDALSLTLADETKTQRRIAKSDVSKVLDPNIFDSKWDGLLIGGAIGTGTGALLGPAVWRGENQPFTNADAAAIYAIIGGLTGGFIGLLLDENRDRPVVLYTARETETDRASPSDLPLAAKLSANQSLEVK